MLANDNNNTSIVKRNDSNLYSFSNLSLMKRSDFSRRHISYEEGYNPLLISSRSPLDELTQMLKTGSSRFWTFNAYLCWLRRLKSLEQKIYKYSSVNRQPLIFIKNKAKSLLEWKQSDEKISMKCARNFLTRLPNVLYDINDGELEKVDPLMWKEL